MTTHEKINISHKNVYVALASAQAEMEQVTKGAINPAFKSRYADLADVVSVVRPALNRHGMAFFHQMVFPDGATHMRTVLIHGESDTRIECDVPLIVAKNDMQGMKSATTYAKRIGLESVTGIAPEDDDGNAAAKAAPHETQRQTNAAPKGAERQAREPKVPTPEQVACESLTNAATLDALAAIWGDLPRDVQRASSVIQAKDARKAALVVPVTDEIPY